jgi:hypothetical protein
MDVHSTQQVAIIGCGLAGCGVVTILKDSFSNMPSAPAYLVAVDDNGEALNTAMADKKIMVRAGEKLEPDIDFGNYAAVFFVLEPSEESSLTWAQVLSSKASEKKAYTLGFLIKPSGGWPEDEKAVYGSFDGSALIDEGWVLRLRKGKDPEYAMRIVFNFIAHTLTIMSGAVQDGKLGKDALWKATYGKVAGFAATSTSQPETLFNMTMSKIDRSTVKSAILFMPEDTDNVLARRIFLYVSTGLPRSIEMIALRVKHVEPFRIVALLAS